MKDLSLFIDEPNSFPNILVVGCGQVGSMLVKAIIDCTAHSACKIYVTDSEKQRARKLSEYRISMITPIRWRDASDTPPDVDVIVVSVDHDSEDKVIDRLIESEKPFISFCDDISTYMRYEKHCDEFEEHGICGVIGSGLVPGLSEILASHVADRFNDVNDIVVDRIGFVSPSSLASVKSARKEPPLCYRDGIKSDTRRDAGIVLSWFPSPYDFVQCQSVAIGVDSLKKVFPNSHNISVRYVEPRLPTFSERIRKMILGVPLPIERALIRVEVHGVTGNGFETDVICIAGDAMSMIIATTIVCINKIVSKPKDISSVRSPFFSAAELIDTTEHVALLMQSCADLFQFDGVDA